MFLVSLNSSVAAVGVGYSQALPSIKLILIENKDTARSDDAWSLAGAVQGIKNIHMMLGGGPPSQRSAIAKVAKVRHRKGSPLLALGRFRLKAAAISQPSPAVAHKKVEN